MAKLLRRTLTDYETLAEWSPGDESSFRAAQQKLRDEINAGWVAVRSDGGRSEPVTELPADAEEVILTTAMGGG